MQKIVIIFRNNRLSIILKSEKSKKLILLHFNTEEKN